MIPETSSDQSSCPKRHIPFSFTKTCFFLLLFLASIVFLLGVPLLCIVLLLKPQMPNFALQTVHVDSYKIDLSSQTLLVSSVFSLDLRAENPNKVGLSYDPSRFHVLSQGLVVGLIRIPQFHQPPLSKNVSIQTRALFQCVNISAIMYTNPRKADYSSKVVFDIRILGDVRAQVRFFHITLPKIKIALDCDISASPSKILVSNEVNSMGWNPNHKISLPLNSQTVSKKCSLAILV